MDYRDFLNINLAELSDDGLVELRNRLEFENGKVIEEWSIDLAQNTDENFDPYSFWGKRKLTKINKKHAHKTADILDMMEEVEKVLIKRDRLKYQKMFDGKDNDNIDEQEINRQEFFEKEELKTLKYKQNIED